jgi:hypothetical protein
MIERNITDGVIFLNFIYKDYIKQTTKAIKKVNTGRFGIKKNFKQLQLTFFL